MIWFLILLLFVRFDGGALILQTEDSAWTPLIDCPNISSELAVSGDAEIAQFGERDRAANGNGARGFIGSRIRGSGTHRIQPECSKTKGASPEGSG
jgi:hypothetical protein